MSRFVAHAKYWIQWCFDPSLRFGRKFGTIARYPICGGTYEPARRFYLRACVANMLQGKP